MNAFVTRLSFAIARLWIIVKDQCLDMVDAVRYFCGNPGKVDFFTSPTVAKMADGSISIPSRVQGHKSIKIYFSCDNPNGLRKLWPTCRRVILENAVAQGFAPIAMEIYDTKKKPHTFTVTELDRLLISE